MEEKKINKTVKRVTGRLLATFFALALLSNPASAETIRAVNTNINPVNANPVITTSFISPGGALRLVVRYNAECSIMGVPTNYLDVNITVNGVVFAPSNSDNAFCSGNGTPTQNDGWVSAMTQVIGTVNVPAGGVVNVVVTATPVPGGTPWRIDDQSLVVESQP